VRAFTGWTLRDTGPDAEFLFDAREHDPYAADGEDLVRDLCSNPAHARFLATKLFAFFAYASPDAETVQRLARAYAANDFEVAPLLRAILTSPEMYAPRALWSAVKSPLDHAVIACRQLLADVDPARIVDALDAQGLVLFNPPDIAGWGSGMRWISSWTLLQRMRFAALVAAHCTTSSDARTASARVDFYLHRLGPLRVAPATRRILLDAASAGDRAVVRLILSSPEWQLN